MRIALALAVVASALAVAATVTAAAAPSGIRGMVAKSPTRPVCEEDMPCSAPAAGVTFAFLRGGVRVATATTSKAGTYRVMLPPGTYVVRSFRKLMFGSPQPRTVRVVRGHFAVANFELDTGIR
jgi:hypothetical protein